MNGSETIAPILVMLVFASVVAGAMLFIAYFMGPSRLYGPKIETYECGMPPAGNARDRVSIKYYLVAILFLLFDLEAAFLIPVAIAWKQLVVVGPIVLGLLGFFMFFFVLGLWYELKVKAIEWER
jgi:NADH-quinone oxidoreductase subunit A